MRIDNVQNKRCQKKQNHESQKGLCNLCFPELTSPIAPLNIISVSTDNNPNNSDKRNKPRKS